MIGGRGIDPFLAWLELAPLSAWVRESDSWLAFPGIISVHAIGLAFVAGLCIAIDIRVLGFLPRVPVAAMARFIPVIWIALVANVASGVLLLLAYPTKALTNPLFFVKMGLIVVGLRLLILIRREVLARGEGGLDHRARTLALSSIGAWVGTIAAGRLLAYTCTRLMVDFGSCF
jgi:hypothetical protein